jgi:cytochrome o ubiquinol oxidase subunit 3
MYVMLELTYAVLDGKVGAFFGANFLPLAGFLAAIGILFAFGRDRGEVEFGEANAIDVESMGLYWHFVDIVWIVIFPVVYLLEYVFLA